MRLLQLEEGNRFHRYAATLLATTAIVVSGLIASSPAQASPRDNLANAKLCLLHQGWQTLKASDGSSFRNLGGCIVYALRGGQFAPPPPPAGGGE
jgi:hypothetical protein